MGYVISAKGIQVDPGKTDALQSWHAHTIQMLYKVGKHPLKNYRAHELEFFALKRSFTEKFHEYLYDNKFQVWTDNKLLMHLLTSAKLDGTRHSWLAELST